MRTNGMPNETAFASSHRQKKTWLTALAVLAVLVVFATVAALTMPASAMTGQDMATPETAETAATGETATPAPTEAPESVQAQEQAQADTAALPADVQVPDGYTDKRTVRDEANGFAVTVYAPEGVIPADATLHATLMPTDSEEYKQAGEQLAEQTDLLPATAETAELSLNGKDTAGETGQAPAYEYAALDIHFEDANGNEIEPDGEVFVTIDAAGLLPEDVDPETITVQHHVEKEEADAETTVTVEPVANTAEAPDAEKVEGVVEADDASDANEIRAAFPVDSFSTFTIMGERRAGGNSGSEVKVYVYVSASGISNECLELLGIDSETKDQNGYFPAGVITLDSSYFNGKWQDANTPGKALINSTDDWNKLLAALGKMDTSTLADKTDGGIWSKRYDRKDYSANRDNHVGEYISQAASAIGASWGSGKTALFRWHENTNSAENVHCGFVDQSVEYHLDLQFTTKTITFKYGNNGIKIGQYQDGNTAVERTYITGTPIQDPGEIPVPQGYSIEGYYTTANFEERWNGVGDLLNENKVVYIKLTENKTLSPLVIEKEVSNQSVTNKNISFTISTTNNEVEGQTYGVSGNVGSGGNVIQFVKDENNLYNATVTMNVTSDNGADGTVYIWNLPVGVDYTITEDASTARIDGYSCTTTYVVNGNGQSTDKATVTTVANSYNRATVEVTNTYGTVTEDATVTTGKTAVLKNDNSGNYDLTLTVSGDRGSTTTPESVDVLFIVDRSDSMNSYSRLDNTKTAMKTLVNSLEGNSNINARYSIVAFSGPTSTGDSDGKKDADVIMTWTAVNGTNVSNSIDGIRAYGGTDYQAGLDVGTDQLSSSDAQTKVVIFLSDGEPTWSYNYGTGGSALHREYHWYETDHWGDSYCTYPGWQETLKQASNISCDYFYAIGIGNSSNSYLDDLVGKVNATTTKRRIAAKNDGSNLTNLFDAIKAQITNFAAENVVMTDPLSQYAEIVPGENGQVQFSVKLEKQDAGGNYQQVGDVQTVASGSDATFKTQATDDNGQMKETTFTITPSFDANSKTITAEIKGVNGATYALAPGYRYSVTTVITPSNTAKSEGMNSNAAQNIPDDNTGTHSVPDEDGNKGKGFWSNDNDHAQVTFEKNGEEGEPVPFPKPVIQVTQTPTADLHFQKMDEEYNTGLGNAEFYLYYEEKVEEGEITKTNRYYYPANGEGDNVNWIPANKDADGEFVVPSGAKKFTSSTDNNPDDGNTTGTFDISNLELVPGRTYILTEVKAPDGYQLPEANIEINVADNGTVTVTKNNVALEAYTTGQTEHSTSKATDDPSKYVYLIPNTTGAQLPATGGMGTNFLTIGGLLLMAAAVGGGCVLRRRRGKEAG